MNRMEAEFSNLVKAYRKRHMGKGPERVTTTLQVLGDLRNGWKPITSGEVYGEDGRWQTNAPHGSHGNGQRDVP